MIQTITANLRRIESLATLSQADYTDTGCGPYHSSIGSHVRHVLDVFACLVNGLDNGWVDLTKRVRGGVCEVDSSEALAYLEEVVAGIHTLESQNIAKPIRLVDDLGDGKVATVATLGAVLFQAHSHAIHHFRHYRLPAASERS